MLSSAAGPEYRPHWNAREHLALIPWRGGHVSYPPHTARLAAPSTFVAASTFRCKQARTSLLSLLKGRRHHRRWAGAASSAAGGRWMGRSGACAERRTVLSRCRARLGAFWTKARGQDGVRGRGASAPAARPATTRGGERKRAGVQCRHRHWLPCCSTPSK